MIKCIVCGQYNVLITNIKKYNEELQRVYYHCPVCRAVWFDDKRIKNDK